MRKTKLFGAVLCSAALAMGMAMPAFAEPTPQVGATFSEWDSSATGNTTIKGTTSETPVVDKVISAKVPISMSVVLGEAGSGSFTAPTSSAYKLTNTGNTAINIYQVSASSAGNGWEITALATGGTISASASGTTKLIGLKLDGVANSLSTTPQNFTGSPIAAGASIGLTVTGATKVGSGATIPSENTPEEMANIIYTISEAV